MEALAEPGKAYLAEAAAELAHGYLDLEDLGEFEIKGVEPAGQGPRADRHRVGAVAARPLARAGLLPVRRPRRRRCRRSRTALEAAEAGKGAVIGIVAEAGRRQEPPHRRVPRSLPRPWVRSLRGAGAVAWPGDSVRAGPPDPPCLLRRLRQRLRAAVAREDRRAGAAARAGPRRGPAGPVRLHGRLGSGPAAATAQPRGPPRSLRTLLCKLLHAPNRAGPRST